MGSQDTVHFFLKDPLNQVYIPGSTLKGAIKTQYGARKANSNQVTQQDCNKLVGMQWDALFTNNERSKHPLIRDSERRDASTALVLSPFEIHAERNSEIRCQQQRIYAEFIGVENNFQTEVAGIEENKLKEILQSASEHARKLVDFECDFFEKYGKDMEYDNVVNFYSQLANVSEGGYLLRIGSGSSFLSSSLLAILALENYQSWQEEFRCILPKRRSRDARTIPNSRKLVRYNNKLYPPGWVEIRLED